MPESNLIDKRLMGIDDSIFSIYPILFKKRRILYLRSNCLMMLQRDFFSMSMDDMIQTLYREGTFIVSIRYYKHKINLYLLSNFYVEVFYNHKFDKIERVELLKRNTKRVKFYADQITLPSDLLPRGE